MNALHIMVDLETWGTTPGSDIRSIGACVFDPVTGAVSTPCQTCKGGTVRGNVNDGGDCSDCLNTRMESGYGGTFYIACDNPISRNARPQFSDPAAVHADREYFLTRDERTVQWWSEQSDEAQAAFANPVDLFMALAAFEDWLAKVTPDEAGLPVAKRTSIRLWAHGPQFDIPILAAAYQAVDLPVPWHYRAPRDTRTCFDMAGINDHSAWLKKHPGPLGIPHHALDDAICQARAVCAAWRPVNVTVTAADAERAKITSLRSEDYAKAIAQLAIDIRDFGLDHEAIMRRSQEIVRQREASR